MRAVFVGVVAMFGVLGACGSDYGEENGGGASSGDPGASSSSGGSSSGSPPVVDAAPAATPGKIECGKQICDVKTQKCCVAGSNDLKCVDSDQGCGSNSGTATCDDAADCTDPTKKICCGEASGFTSNTRCVDKCSGISAAQTCRTNEECGGQDCVKQSCFGFTSYLCGLNTFCQKL